MRLNQIGRQFIMLVLFPHNVFFTLHMSPPVLISVVSVFTSACVKYLHYADDVSLVKTYLNTALLSNNVSSLGASALVKGSMWLLSAWSAPVNQPQVIYSGRKSIPVP